MLFPSETKTNCMYVGVFIRDGGYPILLKNYQQMVQVITKPYSTNFFSFISITLYNAKVLYKYADLGVAKLARG